MSEKLRKTKYTIASEPPTDRKWQARAFWPPVFEEARQYPSEWRRTQKCFTKGTAQQAASDLRNAHHRDVTKMRFRGINSGELWEAQWGNDPADPNATHFYLWVRYLGRTGGAGS
jgi:hypothetical protein